MKKPFKYALCVRNDLGYERVLKIGKYYEVISRTNRYITIKTEIGNVQGIWKSYFKLTNEEPMKNKPLIINRSGTSRRTIYKNENPIPDNADTYTVTHEEWNEEKKEFEIKFRKDIEFWYEACNFVNYKLCLLD